MFGMPSRVRVLVHGLGTPKLGQEPLAVDRELDLAIVEFAPGSERTKDKRLLRSIGLTTPYIVADEGGQPRWALPPNATPYKSAGNLLLCRRCGYAESVDSEIRTACVNCGEQRGEGPLAKCRLLPLAVPSGFRTSLDPDAADTDADPERSRPANHSMSIAVTSMGNAVPETTACNTRLRLVLDGRVYRINDNGGSLFEGGTVEYPCYHTQGAVRVAFSLPSQWIAKEYALPQFAPQAQGEHIALVSPKTTDVLHIRPAANPHGLSLSPLNTQPIGAEITARAAYYSAGFMLIHAAAEELDVDPVEFEISGLSCPTTGGQGYEQEQFGELLINDRVPNGFHTLDTRPFFRPSDIHPRGPERLRCPCTCLTPCRRL